MQVYEVMVTNVVTISRNDDLLRVEDMMAEHHIRHIPVLDEDIVVGLITQRDLFKARMSSAMGYGEKGQRALLHTVAAKEIMSYPVITVSPETPLTKAAELIIDNGIGCLPVMKGDELVGIVTKTNLLQHLRDLGATEPRDPTGRDKPHGERGLPNVMPY